MPFSDPTPTLEFQPDEKWKVARAFSFTLGEDVAGLPRGLVIRIPKGMITDLASIPRAFWPLLPPNGDYAPAAIVHDFLYRRHRVEGTAVTRAQADAVLLAAMRDLGDVSWTTRWAIYLAVRVGAWWAWPNQTGDKK